MVERDNIKLTQKILNLLTSPVTISIMVFIAVTAFVIVVTGYKILSIKPDITWGLYNKTFLENVLVEAHGMLFDILVIGILILFLNKLAEKRITNQRYIDEIDDFRGWLNKEAAHRIAGNIKRLNRNGFKGKINLSDCFLNSIDLNGINLQEANLDNAKLQNADLKNANLQKAYFVGANLKKADLKGANLKGADLKGANLVYADRAEANLSSEDLKGADLAGADL